LPDLKRGDSNSPQVILVIFEITDNGTGATPSAAILNKQISPGKLKRDYRGNKPAATEGHFTINFLDKNKKTISSHHVSNPLTENVEYVDDEGQLARKEITHLKKDIAAIFPENRLTFYHENNH